MNSVVIGAILEELKFAQEKYPNNADERLYMALAEEVGELATAMMGDGGSVYHEAKQVATVAIRIMTEIRHGDLPREKCACGHDANWPLSSTSFALTGEAKITHICHECLIEKQGDKYKEFISCPICYTMFGMPPTLEDFSTIFYSDEEREVDSYEIEKLYIEKFGNWIPTGKL